MTTTTITTKGQIVIPAGIRKRLHLKKGAKLYIEEGKDELIIRSITSAYFEKIAGVLPTKGKLAQALLKERSKDKKKED